MHKNTITVRGFTLVEVIIVIFILALASGLMMMRLSATSPARTTERAVKQLKSFLQVAQQQAIVQPAVLGLSLADEGYQILEYEATDPPVWVPMSRRAPFWQPQALDPNIRMRLIVDDQSVLIPLSLSLVQQPQVMLLPSGEITPFQLQIQYPGVDYTYLIEGNFAGGINLRRIN